MREKAPQAGSRLANGVPPTSRPGGQWRKEFEEDCGIRVLPQTKALWLVPLGVDRQLEPPGMVTAAPSTSSYREINHAFRSSLPQFHIAPEIGPICLHPACYIPSGL